MEEIAKALKETAAELSWTATRLAVEVNKTERTAFGWLNGTTNISGPDLLHLMRRMPGLAERLGMRPFVQSEAA